MVRADERLLLVAAGHVLHARAAMAADVEERGHLPVVAADDQQRVEPWATWTGSSRKR